MSFTTRCPSCGTVFRVVADQLKISDGWVRCGHCNEVFDATIQLQAWVPPGAEPAPPQPPAPSPPPSPSTAPPPTGWPADDSVEAWFGPEPGDGTGGPRGPSDAVSSAALLTAPAARVVYTNEVAAAPDPAPESAPESDFHAELERFASSARGSSSAEVGAEVARSDALGDDVHLSPSEDGASTGGSGGAHDMARDAPMPEPSFVRQARRQAIWSTPGMRAVLAVLCLLLVALLGLQWVGHERHRLVAAQPAWRPAIEQWCAWTGCSLAPPQRIEAVVIDSAELVRRLGDFYSFDLVLRNQSDLAVAVPAVELSLTDSGDRVIARRVFLPQDWPNAPQALAPRTTTSVSFRLALSMGDHNAAMSGYRALVFYP